jgi:glycosyltransferase involved in cell wall biosynthesis
MKILVITDLYPTEKQPRRGIFIYHLLRFLSRLCEVRLIQPLKIEENREYKKDNLTINQVSYHDPLFIREYTRAWKMKNPVLNEVEKISEQFDFDLILGIFTVPGGYLAAKAAALFNKPFAVLGVGSDIHFFHNHFILGKMTLQTLKKANKVIVNADNLKDKAIKLGVDPERVTALQFGYDERIFNTEIQNHKKSGLPIILMVANLVEVKCPHTFIDAALILLNSGIKAEFALAGDGFMRNELENKVNNSQFSEYIKFYGSIDQPKLAELYAAASCTVLTSRSEGLPCCLIESLACGTPAVSTNLPGVREIITDGKNGILTKINAPAETAEAIKKVLSWEKTKQEIAESVKNRTWQKHAEKFIQILKEVVKK